MSQQRTEALLRHIEVMDCALGDVKRELRALKAERDELRLALENLVTMIASAYPDADALGGLNQARAVMAKGKP